MTWQGLSESPGNAVPPRESAVDFAGEFKQSHRVLWTIAAGIVGNSAAADDVVQEAAVLGLEKLDQFQPGTNFRAWMAQMVRFIALNHARRQKKHRATSIESSGDESEMPIPAPPSEPRLKLLAQGQLPPDQSEFDDQLMSALNSVQPVARACLLLRTVEQLEYSEISKVLDIPEGTAMSHVHRTRQYLRERLAGKGPIRKEVRP